MIPASERCATVSGGGVGTGGAGSLPKVARQIFALRHLAIETYPLRPPFSLLPPVTRPLCGEAARAAAVGQAGRQNPRQKRKFPPPVLPEVTEVQQPAKAGLCIFKSSEGAARPSSKAQVQGKKKKKTESCQMIFVLSNDLERRGTLRTRARSLRRRPRVAVTYSLPFFSQASHGRILIAYISD